MVSFVIVSHSDLLAQGVVDLTKMSAPYARIVGVGGLEDGTYGTSFDKIQTAIEGIYTTDGVLVLVDIGSAVMMTKKVLESNVYKNVRMVDCPLVEGAFVGTIMASSGSSLDEIETKLKNVKNSRKF